MSQEFQGVFIEAIAACVPQKKILGNHFSEILNAKEIRKFERTTGILERRYVDETTTASDLGYLAAKKIIEENTNSSDIKALVFVSQTADYKIPFTSNILQQKLNLSTEILCLDINAGCAGFVQGLSVSYALANSMNGKVLLIIAETMSKILSPSDRTTATLFGDGAAAILINKNTLKGGKSYFNFFSDGDNFDAIMISDGGYRNPVNKNSLILEEDEKGNKKHKLHLSMDGPRVFDFTLREIPKSIEQLFDTYSINKEDIDGFLFHQSNKFIIKQIASKLGVSKDKVPLNIHNFGNTSGVTIPLLMVTEYSNNRTSKKLLLSGYGVGLNWGNCVISLNEDVCIHELMEV